MGRKKNGKNKNKKQGIDGHDKTYQNPGNTDMQTNHELCLEENSTPPQNQSNGKNVIQNDVTLQHGVSGKNSNASDSDSDQFHECNNGISVHSVNNQESIDTFENDCDAVTKHIPSLQKCLENLIRLQRSKEKCKDEIKRAVADEKENIPIDRTAEQKYEALQTKFETLEEQFKLVLDENKNLKNEVNVNETLRNENNSMIYENETLKNKIIDFEKETKRYQESIVNLQEERQNKEAELNTLKQEIKVTSIKHEKQLSESGEFNRQLMQKIKTTTETINQLQNTNKNNEKRVKDLQNEIKNKCQQIEDQQQQNDKLTNSVSEMMNNKMAKNESDLENINNKNRPLKVADEYGLFCSDIWLQAKSFLDENIEKLSEKEKHDLLVDIMMNANTHSILGHQIQLENISWCLDDPLASQNWTAIKLSQVVKDSFEGQQTKSKGKVSLPEDMDLAVTKYLKLHSDNVDCSNMALNILTKTVTGGRRWQSEMNDQLIKSVELIDFATESCKFCWKMSVQTPIMKFQADDHDKMFDNEKHELSYSSLDPKTPDAVIGYYVYPCLYQGDKIMGKAKVCLVKYSDHEEID